ncbi:MAG: hypothetical protein ACREBO_12695 [Novosphingobium sp.]
MTDRATDSTRRAAPAIAFNDPDGQNSEQSEAGAQAQDVARDAQESSGDAYEESERGGHGDPAQLLPDDTPDLVEKMNEMVRSGRIDRDAFAGEDNMDEEDLED